MHHDGDPRAHLRSSLDRDGRELRLALRELERATRAKLDVHRIFADHHAAVLLGGFVLGFLLGVRVSHGRPIVVIAGTPLASLR